MHMHRTYSKSCGLEAEPLLLASSMIYNRVNAYEKVILFRCLGTKTECHTTVEKVIEVFCIGPYLRVKDTLEPSLNVSTHCDSLLSA